MEELRLRACRWCGDMFALCGREVSGWFCAPSCRDDSDRHKHCIDSEHYRQKKRAQNAERHGPVEIVHCPVEEIPNGTVEEIPTVQIQASGEESSPVCEMTGRVPITPPASPPGREIETRSADAKAPVYPQPPDECGP